jgi:glycerol uptake facilitator-like aquaporin
MDMNRRLAAEFIGTMWLALGGIAGALVPYLIASGKAGLELSAGFASNGYGDHSPGKYSMLSGLIREVAMTFVFLVIILGAAAAGVAYKCPGRKN